MSSIHLSSLKSALRVIAKIGHGELTFPVDGVPVTFRMLTRAESLEVYYYAKEEEEDTIAFMERFRVDTLARAIVQIGDTNLRDVQYVETDDVSESGRPVMVERHKAIRQLVSEWSQPAMLGLFNKYEELKRRLEDEADTKIVFHVDDLKVEIARVEARLAMLQRDYEAAKGAEAASSIPSTLQKLNRKVAELPDQGMQAPPDREVQIPRGIEAPPSVHRAPPVHRALPDAEAPVYDSVSLDDDAIRRENERLMQMRSQRGMHAAPVPSRRPPPHQQATQAATGRPPQGKILDEDSFFQGSDLQGRMKVDPDPSAAPPTNARFNQR